LAGPFATAISAFLAAFGYPDPIGIFGRRVSGALKRRVKDLEISVKALKARGLISQTKIESEGFAFLLSQVVSQLARTAQEEKRRYLCNGLLNIACASVEEDDAALLLGLVDELTLRHIIVLADLAEQMPHYTSCRDPEATRLYAVWERLKERFPRVKGHDEKNTRYVFVSIVANLRGRGLIEDSPFAGDAGSNPGLRLTVVAHSLLAFIRDPVEKEDG
jgi:hypothetical protein